MRHIVAEATSKELKLEAEKAAAAAARAAAAHRLSGSDAARDIDDYWGKFQAKTKALNLKKGAGGGMSSRAANADLDAFLSKMVAKARVAHRVTEAAAKARRAETNSAKEAVAVRHLTDAQARRELDSWWGKDMASHGGTKGGRVGASVHKDAGAKASRGKAHAKGKGLTTFSAASAAKEMEVLRAFVLACWLAYRQKLALCNALFAFVLK